MALAGLQGLPDRAAALVVPVELVAVAGITQAVVAVLAVILGLAVRAPIITPLGPRLVALAVVVAVVFTVLAGRALAVVVLAFLGKALVGLKEMVVAGALEGQKEVL